MTPLQANNFDVSLLTGETGKQIKKLREGRWTKKSFVDGSAVRAVFVLDHQNSRYRPIDEVRPTLRGGLMRTARARARRDLREEWLKEVEYEFVLSN